MPRRNQKKGNLMYIGSGLLEQLGRGRSNGHTVMLCPREREVGDSIRLVALLKGLGVGSDVKRRADWTPIGATTI
jgi:hypothetical protein